MPKRLRTPLREQLFRNTLRSLELQKSKNWKAIVIGDNFQGLDNEHFIQIEADDFTKTQKLSKALQYIEQHPEIKPEYLIRLDADDIICPNFLYEADKLPERYDAYFDKYHVCIDPVYMKISYRKNSWIANTAIHKYEHAINRCGPQNQILFLQDHDSFWHHYYKDKKTISPQFKTPLYYRILTPVSITSGHLNQNAKTDWKEYSNYLNSYGPWVSLKKTFHLYDELKKISSMFDGERPHRSSLYWLFNYVKHVKDNIVVKERRSVKKNPDVTDQSVAPVLFQTCVRCLLTTKDTSYITFDTDGLCNYCRYYDKEVKKLGSSKQRKEFIDLKITQIKAGGKGKPYDCILGVSGGVDSTYLSYWAKEAGLRPLVVHFDNGWNSELAVQNITNICNKLQFELQTHVINWEEFKDLQLAYLKSGVIDIEVLTDHAIMATVYKIAAKKNIQYTLNGFNLATEAIMPKDWVFDKGDWENIKDIYKQFGSGRSIKSFPHISFYKKLYYHWFLKLESVQILNYIEYNKEEAKKTITEKLGWRDYGGKHYESVFTKFYQAYILPQKFGVDKRKAHLSTLICSGQISKDEALEELKKPLYPEQELTPEKNYILKKLNLSEKDFEQIMKLPIRLHHEFKTEKKLWGRYFKLVKIIKFDFKK